MAISARTWRKLLREIRESNRILSRREIEDLANIRARTMANNQQNTLTFNGLSKWSTEGLNLTDTGFSKLHSKESHFEKDGTKYDLSAETFRTYTRNLIEKVERIHAVKDFQITIRTNKNAFALKEYTSISVQQMTTDRNNRWPDAIPQAITTQAEAYRFTDTQIKRSVVGAYIHDSLTEEAKVQLDADSDQFKVKDLNGESYYDGPSYFHCIARLVDPDNGHLVSKTKTAIRNLNVKDFGFNVKKMLAEFKNLKTRIYDLDGQYSRDDQFLDLWNAVATLREKEFTRFVQQLEDDEARKDVTNRSSIDEVIREICAKQTRMETKNNWNVMSKEDTIIMTLMGMVENGNGSQSKKAKTGGDTGTDSVKASKRAYVVPEWKKVSPKSGEPTTKVVDNRTYHWCKKCRDGEGMWAMHDVHVDNFKLKKNNDSNGAKQATATKSVTFNVTGDVGGTTSQHDNELKMQVKPELLADAKAYLTQLSDFQAGGARR